MLIYFILYLLMIVGYLLINRIKCSQKTRQIVSIVYLVGLVFLLLALRHPIMGIDLGYGSQQGYIGSFQRISGYSWNTIFSLEQYKNYEWGYVFYNKLLSYISTEPQFLIIITALLSIVPVGFMLNKYCEDKLFSMVVYLGLPCFLILFSGLRQGLAIGICCLSYKFLTERKLIRFVLVVLFASLFHYSALIFLLAYLAFGIRMSKPIRFLTIPTIALVFILREPLFGLLASLFKENAVIDNNGAFTQFLVFVLVYVFCSIFVDEEDRVASGFLNVFYLACLCLCFSGLYNLAARMAYYFMLPMSIVLPNVVAGIRENRAIYKLGIEGVFAAYGIYAIVTTSWVVGNPYIFFWQF